MAAHALLGASSAYRWMACPGSVRLSAGIGSSSSPYAIEGTHAHTLGEKSFETGHPPEWFVGKTLKDHEGSFEVTEEMAEAVEVYTDYCRKLLPGGYITPDNVECKLSLEDLHPDMWGTADFVHFDAAANTLYVVDYKHGQGYAVDVRDNPQALFYGAGARRLFPDVDRIVIVIVQPRAQHPDGPIREAEYDLLDLLSFEQKLQKHAVATQAEDAPIAAGPHCNFCPAAPFCDVRQQTIEDAAQDAFGELIPAETMSGDKLGATLRMASEIKDWIKAVETYAQRQAQTGNLPTGFKLITKGGRRSWSDTDAVEKQLLLQNSVTKDMLYGDPKFKTVAQMEKAVGKEEVAKLAEFISRGETSMLVPEEDPRPATLRGADHELGSLEEMFG